MSDPQGGLKCSEEAPFQPLELATATRRQNMEALEVFNPGDVPMRLSHSPDSDSGRQFIRPALLSPPDSLHSSTCPPVL